MKKHDILIAAAGLFAGLAISALLLSVLTSLDRTASSEEDVVELIGVDVVASISNLRRQRAIGTGGAETS